jgi:serine/threonine-protein kinase
VRETEVIDGRYRVERVVGTGCGTLVVARHRYVGREVMVRIVRPAADGAAALERLVREMAALVVVDSPHVVRLLDAGELSNGGRYLVRELAVGWSLDACAQPAGLSVALALELALQLCRALGTVHASGLVLCGLEPRHVVCAHDGGVLTARIVEAGWATRRGAPAPMRIAATVPPELVRGAVPADERADVWTLGCLAYLMLTGRPPFDGQAASLLDAIVHHDPVPPSALRDGIPSRLDAAVLAALAKSPARRPADALALARLLAPAREVGRPVASPARAAPAPLRGAEEAERLACPDAASPRHPRAAPLRGAEEAERLAGPDAASPRHPRAAPVPSLPPVVHPPGACDPEPPAAAVLHWRRIGWASLVAFVLAVVAVAPVARRAEPPAPVVSARSFASTLGPPHRWARASASSVVEIAAETRAVGVLRVRADREPCHFTVGTQGYQGWRAALEIPLAPGVHEVACRRPGGRVERRMMKIAAGKDVVTVFR